MEDEIVNAEIRNTKLGREDHGILTFMLYLDYGGTTQGFGGFGLDSGKAESKGREYVSMEIISRVLDVVGVEDWEDLKGTHIRVRRGLSMGPIIEIGNLLKDDWLNLKEFFAGGEEDAG